LRLRLIRGRRDRRRLFNGCLHILTYRLAMRHDVQVLDRVVSRVDRALDRMASVKPEDVQPTPTEKHEKKHRHHAVAEGCGLLGCEARAFNDR
jgi:hypothetical protein